MMLMRTGIPAALRVLVITGLLYYAFTSYGRATFYRDPGSMFFDISRAFERYYSLVRELEASDWKNTVFHQLNGHSNESTHGVHDVLHRRGANPQVCAVFVTAHREGGPQYIDLAIGSALAGMTPSERADLDLRMYVANTDPSIHPAWDSWLGSVIDEQFTARDVVYASKLTHLKTLEKEKKYHEKAGLDYSVALQRCAQDSAAPYVAIFEGDVIVADGWLARAMKGVQTIRQQYEMNLDNWLDMRLFDEERSTGWESSGLFDNHVILISLGVDLVALLVGYVLKRKKLPGQCLVSPLSMLLICCLTIPGIVILFFQAGKASMLPPPAGVHREDGFGCCNQAILYSRNHVSDLASYLEEKSKEKPHDNAIMDYSREKQLARFALHPMMVQHVGFKSIINPNRRDDMEVWSMAFESLDQELLAKQHESMVKEIYGPDAWVPQAE